VYETLVAKVRAMGPSQAIGESSARFARRVLPTAFHKVDRPHLRAFYNAGPVFLSVEELLLEIADTDSAQLARLRQEHTSLLREIERRRVETGLNYPESFGSGGELSFALYSLLRLRRPQCVLETGVADGFSTFFLLSAVAKNGSGSIHSVEVDRNCGSLLSDSERGAWNLHIISAKRPRAFKDVVALITPDLFFHDSNHLYYWAHFEYATIRGQLGERCLITSDDVDKSFAFLDFCSTGSLAPAFLLDRWKLFGIALPQRDPHASRQH
jgi:hypothetical protein